MSGTGGLDRLTVAIKTAVEKAKKGRAAVRGRVQGGQIAVGTKMYQKKLAIDLNVREGDFVWAQITDDDSTAVIVGG